jgi:hypothetical protein
MDLLCFIRRRAVAPSLCALFLLTFLHCKTESSESSSERPSVDPGAGAPTRESFIARYCELARQCCPDKGSTGCEKSLSTFIPKSFDSASGKACLDAVSTNSTGEHFCSKGVFLSGVPACSRLSIRGTTPVGGSCADAVTGSECATSPEGPVACVNGKGKQICQLQKLGELGEACVEDSEDDGSLPSGASLDVEVTEKGTYCDRSKGLHCRDQKCEKLFAIGASCTDSESCVAEALCDYASKKCKARVEDGSACVGDTECQSEYCDNVTRKCSSSGPPFLLQTICGR